MTMMTAAAIVGGIGAAGMIGSSLIGANAAGKAAKVQANAANQATELQKQMWEQQQAQQKPFLEAGYAGSNRLMELLGIGGDQGAAGYGSAMKPFSMADFQADPGYNFRLTEGLKALDRQAAARGGLISGGALKAAQRYGQDAASQEYQNAFNRYQINRSNQLNPLQSISGAGQTAANTLTSAGGQYATNAGNLMTSGAAARASGYMGSANAIAGGVGQFVNNMNQQYSLDKILNRNPNGVPDGTGGTGGPGGPGGGGLSTFGSADPYATDLGYLNM